MPKPKDEAEKAEKKIDWDEIDFRNEIDAQRDVDTTSSKRKLMPPDDPLQDPNSEIL